MRRSKPFWKSVHDAWRNDESGDWPFVSVIEKAFAVSADAFYVRKRDKALTSYMRCVMMLAGIDRWVIVGDIWRYFFIF
jgi:hypothetical protein